jgi:hypothetical protein
VRYRPRQSTVEIEETHQRRHQTLLCNLQYAAVDERVAEVVAVEEEEAVTVGTTMEKDLTMTTLVVRLGLRIRIGRISKSFMIPLFGVRV